MSTFEQLLREEEQRQRSINRGQSHSSFNQLLDEEERRAQSLPRRAMDRLDQAGRQGMGGFARSLPPLRPVFEGYQNLTGRQVMPDRPPEGLLERGFSFTGEALPLVGATNYMLAQRAAAPLTGPGARGVQSVVDNLAAQNTNFMAQRPITSLLADVGGTMGAGAGAEQARLSGNENLEPVGAVVGGVMGAATPAAVPQLYRSALQQGRSLIEDAFPRLTSNVERKVARTLQQRSADPSADAARALSAEDGLTGPQASQNERLMALQRRAQELDPELDARIQAGQARARTNVEGETRGMFGSPLEPAAHQRSLIQSVAPEGVVINQADPDQMLAQVYRSFDPEYRFIDNIRMPTRGFAKGLVNAVRDPNIYGGGEAAPTALAWMRSRTKDMSKHVGEDGMIDASWMRKLRTEIRDTRRALGPEERADRAVLDNADAYITRHLEQNLPADARGRLSAVDQQYSRYKILEDALSMGDGPMTPDRLQAALRNATDAGQFARGQTPVEDMRSSARLLDNATDMMGRPDIAKQRIRGLNERDANTLRSTFLRDLYDGATQVDRNTGQLFIDGPQFKAAVLRQGGVFDGLGVSATDKARLNQGADLLVQIQRPQPDAAGRLFDDAPHMMLDLMTRLSGSKAATWVAEAFGGTNAGISLIMAQFGSRTARALRAEWGSVPAEKMLLAAFEPTPEGRRLYAALMTRPSDTAAKKEAAAQTIAQTLARLSPGVAAVQAPGMVDEESIMSRIPFPESPQR